MIPSASKSICDDYYKLGNVHNAVCTWKWKWRWREWWSGSQAKISGHGFCHGWGRDVALEDAIFSASWVSEGWMSPSEKVSVPSMVDQWHCPTGPARVALSWHGEGGRLEGNTFSLSFPYRVGLAIVTVSSQASQWITQVHVHLTGWVWLLDTETSSPKILGTKSSWANKIHRIYVLLQLVWHFDKPVNKKLLGHGKKFCIWPGFIHLIPCLLFVSYTQIAW